MNSIDNLRDYVLTAPSICSTTRAILVGYIDSIDKEVDDMWHALTIDAKPMTDENMAESGWVRLPVDADGVPIHVGDVMEFTYDPPQDQPLFEVSGFGADGTLFYAARSEVAPRKVTNATVVRHHHAPTVEDVLREFADEVWNRCCEGATASDSGIDGLVAEYAARLRLAGDE